MTFKPFFIHFNRPVKRNDNSRLRHNPRGFTAYIAPSDKERKIQVSGSFCSTKDEFVKHRGRVAAASADVVEINPRDLPKMLASMKVACFGGSSSQRREEEYYYTLKYVL